MPNNISKPLVFGEHALCITNTSKHSFGELVDCLQLSLLPFSLRKLSLIIYIRKYLNGLPFWHRAKHLEPMDTSYYDPLVSKKRIQSKMLMVVSAIMISLLAE
jgi:hypothetical protein